MLSPGDYFGLLRNMGPGWALHRAGYAARRKLGFLKRSMPALGWESVPKPALKLRPRSVARAQLLGWGGACQAEADRVLSGEFRLFSDHWVTAGTSPDWNRNRLSGERIPDGVHWTELGDFAFGDIKGVWELSRFSWAFALARAHARTGDGRYAAAFWRLFADWCRQNPPNTGPNWMCGQESAFRLIAAVFASEVVGVPEAERDGFSRFVFATGGRIASNLGHALSQKNNHGVSECVGLVTAALLVPDADESPGWLSQGLRGLEAQLAELVYDDGGFAQHSLIYHRVLLHDLTWCRSRLVSAGMAIPGWIDDAGARALGFLIALVDPSSGDAPLYGANDGANLLQLSEAGFLDLRPTVQAAAAVFRGELPIKAGPWDEAASWLAADWDGLRRVEWPSPAPRWHARSAGCFQMTSGPGRLFLRCPTKFRHRPGQADMLHVDIWHNGRAVASDGGTFSYNSGERFTALADAAQHNVLTVDGMEPMERVGRFLYLPWPEGSADDLGEGGFRAVHNGYSKLGIRWVRVVSLRAGNGFVVRDRVTGVGGHNLRWHWRLADLGWTLGADGSAAEARTPKENYTVRLLGPAGSRTRLLRADPATASGWWSPHYAAAAPACALVLDVDASGDIELETEFNLPD